MNNLTPEEERSWNRDMNRYCRSVRCRQRWKLVKQFAWPVLFALAVMGVILAFFSCGDPVGRQLRQGLTPEYLDHSRIPDTLKIDSAILREQDSAVGISGSCDTCENGIHIPDTAREGGGL